MSEQTRSNDWHHVRALAPAIRDHVRVHRHVYGRSVWHVLEDPLRHKQTRLDANAWRFVGQLDGRRTVESIWQSLAAELDEDAPTQQEIVELLGQLHQSDLLRLDRAPDHREITRRGRDQAEKEWRQRWLNPLAVRIPLLDPHGFVSRLLPLVSPLFSWAGTGLWLALVLLGGWVALVNGNALAEFSLRDLMQPASLMLTVLAYVGVKTIHEFGHAFAVRRWGGEVHEMGVLLLVLFPVPYVEASAASAFPEHRRRIVVSAVGIMVELGLAAIACLVWSTSEPGIVRDAAWQVMLIGGISTLFFNGNPLLRFDGYFVLSDLLQIPNLGQRSNRYYRYLAERYLFGVAQSRSPVRDRREIAWFVSYGLAAQIYRLIIMLTIALYLAEYYLLPGLLLAGYTIVSQVVLPLGKGCLWLLTHGDLRRTRMRAIGVASGISLMLVLALGAVPLPVRVVLDGVVEPIEQAIVRPDVDGFVEYIAVRQGDHVTAGTLLLVLADPALRRDLAIARAQLAEATLLHRAAVQVAPAEARQIHERARGLRTHVTQLQQKSDNLRVIAESDGQVVFDAPEDLAGRFIRKGDIVGHIRANHTLRLTLVADQNDAERLADAAPGVEVRRRREDRAETLAASVSQGPVATRSLPHAALARQHGGPFLIDPVASELTSEQPLLRYDITLSDPPPDLRIGERLRGRFDCGTEPAIAMIGRQLRQLFLSRFAW